MPEDFAFSLLQTIRSDLVGRPPICANLSERSRPGLRGAAFRLPRRDSSRRSSLAGPLLFISETHISPTENFRRFLAPSIETSLDAAA
jgi:hypothetical protein